MQHVQRACTQDGINGIKSELYIRRTSVIERPGQLRAKGPT